MNIENLEVSISFSKMLRDFEFEYNLKDESLNRDDTYYNRFLDFLTKNRAVKFYEYFSNDVEFSSFLKANFMNIPFKYFYNRVFFKKKINRMICTDLEFFHNDINRLTKLLSFYQVPEFVLDVYDQVLMKYFNEDTEGYQEFMETLFYNQKVPIKIILSNLLKIKRNPDISYKIVTSKFFKHYYDNLFESNRILFNEIRTIAMTSKLAS